MALGFAVLLGCTPARGLAAEPVRYAGIDVGSKGVKATIIEIVPGKANPVSSIYTKTTNPTVGLLKDGKFRQEAMAEVAADVDRFVKDFRSKYQVPLENIHVVGSSSLAEVPNRSGLVSEVEKRSGQKMSFIDVGREIRLSLEGLVLQGDKNQALLIDVGSGNTKGGYFTDLDKVETFSIPFGTVSFTTKIKNILNKGESFADVATKLRQTPDVKTPPDGRGKARAEKAIPGIPYWRHHLGHGYVSASGPNRILAGAAVSQRRQGVPQVAGGQPGPFSHY